MKILQADIRQYHQIRQYRKRILIVESQVYGQDDDLIFHIACSNEIADELKHTFFLREIPDTGRTPGFWQNLGGSGVYKPKSVVPTFFSPRIATILRNKAEAQLSYTGATWRDIIASFPAKFSGMKAKLGVFEETLSIGSVDLLKPSVQNGHSNILEGK